MICDKCHAEFKIDLFVPHAFWQTIKPKSEGKGGYLCPKCIIVAMENAGVVVAGLNDFITLKDLEELKR